MFFSFVWVIYQEESARYDGSKFAKKYVVSKKKMILNKK